jgi:hypothetical protein
MLILGEGRTVAYIMLLARCSALGVEERLGWLRERA